MSENIKDTMQPRDFFGFDACDDSQPFIFVSYAHADAKRIAPYVSYLNDNGVRVWYDNGLKPGQKWLEMLLTKISLPTCMAVMFFLSSDSVGSPFVRAETEQAFKSKKPIYGVYLEDNLALDVEMNAYISRIQSTFITRHNSIATAQNEILLASMELMRGERPGVAGGYAGTSQYDDEYRKAELLFSHTRFDGTHDRIDEAQAIYKELSQQNMMDYRGWFGLLKCACLKCVATPEDASEQIKAALDYHSYAVNCNDSPELRDQCMECLDFLWDNTLAIFEYYLAQNNAKTSSEAQAFAARLPDSRMLRHVSPAVTARYTDIAGQLKAHAEKLAQDEENKRLAEIEAEKQQQEEERKRREDAEREEAERIKAEQEAAQALAKKRRRQRKIGMAWRIAVCTFITLSAACGLLIVSNMFLFKPLKVIYTISLAVLGAVHIISTIISHRNAKYSKTEAPNKRAISIAALVTSALLILILPICALNGNFVLYNGVKYQVASVDGSTARIWDIDYDVTEVTIPATIMGAEVNDALPPFYSPYLLKISVDADNKYFSSIDGVLFNKGQKTLVSFPRGRSGQYSIPDGVTTIRDRAFQYCDNLTSITIPDSVTTIGADAFCSCSSLTSITIPDSAANFSSIDGVLFSKNQKKLIVCPGGRSGQYIIPNSVTTIRYGAFGDCDSLTSITIPDSVTTIEADAFWDCDSLTSITIPDSVTTIEADAFWDCDNLTSITIPDSVTTIGEGAFDYCYNLTVICSPDSYAWQYCEDNNIPHSES